MALALCCARPEPRGLAQSRDLGGGLTHDHRCTPLFMACRDPWDMGSKRAGGPVPGQWPGSEHLAGSLQCVHR